MSQAIKPGWYWARYIQKSVIKMRDGSVLRGTTQPRRLEAVEVIEYDGVMEVWRTQFEFHFRVDEFEFGPRIEEPRIEEPPP